jgi:hypothetical protein
MTNHKANPEHWQLLEEYAGINCYSDACLLELRARIETLEAANSQPTPNQIPLRSSLVERVQQAIGHSYPDDARAAIREVAAWMTSNPDVYFPPALVFALEQEAER